MTKELKRLSLAELIPYAKNPRKNDEAAEHVAQSMAQCGDIAPIIVDENLVILAGHTRLKAHNLRGDDEADVLIVSGLTEEQKRKYRLLDNKTSEKAGWDFALLEQELEGLDFHGWDFGFNSEKGTIVNEELLNQFFSDSESETEKPKKTVTCPHCGNTIEV